MSETPWRLLGWHSMRISFEAMASSPFLSLGADVCLQQQHSISLEGMCVLLWSLRYAHGWRRGGWCRDGVNGSLCTCTELVGERICGFCTMFVLDSVLENIQQ